MILSHTRRWVRGPATVSAFAIDGVEHGFVLEPTAETIPLGRYPVKLTWSKRAAEGALWCPAVELATVERHDFVLPQIMDVPGRTGIRYHAGNVVGDSDGCGIGGFTRAPYSVGGSRRWLRSLMALMAGHDDVWVDLTEEHEA